MSNNAGAFSGGAGVVDDILGQAYMIVKHIYDNLGPILEVANRTTKIDLIKENLDLIEGSVLSSRMATILEVIGNYRSTLSEAADIPIGSYFSSGDSGEFKIYLKEAEDTYTDVGNLIEPLSSDLMDELSALYADMQANLASSLTTKSQVEGLKEDVIELVSQVEDLIANTSFVNIAKSAALADKRAASRYTVYDPGTTWVTAYNGETDASGYIYGHDSAIAAFDGGYVLLWNAGMSAYEGASPQVLLEKHATTVAGLASATISVPFAATGTSDGTQWQPGMIVAGNELWALWTQIDGVNQGTYWSRKSSLAGAWTTSNLGLAPLTKNGITYEVCYITGDPVAITLDDGTVRYLCPAAFESQTSYTATASMPNSAMSGNFTRCAKMAGVLILDEGDASWRVGGMVADPVYPWLTWEPAISVDAAGAVRLRMRSMNHFAGALAMMVETISYDDGESFGPLVPMDMHSGQTRNAHRIGDPLNGTLPLFVGNDCYISQPGMAFSPGGRRSLALYAGNGDRDMIPGAVISNDDVDRTACYPSLTEAADKLVVSYSCTLRSPQNFANTIRVATINKPTGAQIMIRGNGNDYKSPAFVAAGGGEWAHFAYHPQTTLLTAATMASLGLSATVQTVVLIGKLSDRGGIFDCRAGGQTGYGIRTHGTLQIDCYHSIIDPTYGIYPGVTIDTGLTVPLDEEILIALAIDGVGQSVTAHVVRKNGTVSTATVAISRDGTPFTPRTFAPTATAYMGSSRDDSALGAARMKLRCEKIYGSVLTANNLRYIHGQHAAALGMTVWAGTATDPGAATIDLDATDVSAGTNNGTWTSKFGKTDLTDGSASVTTHSGREVLLITGQRSASLVPPLGGRLPNHWTFEYETQASRSAETTLCTLGDARNNVRLVKTASGAVVAREMVDNVTRADITVTAASSDGDPRRVTIVLGNGTVTVTESGNKLTLPYYGRNILFLGKAWLLNTTDTNNGCYFFVDSVASKNAVVNEADYLPMLRERRYSDGAVELLSRLGGALKLGGTTFGANGFLGVDQSTPLFPTHISNSAGPGIVVDGQDNPAIRSVSSATSGTFKGGGLEAYAGPVTAGNIGRGYRWQATNGSGAIAVSLVRQKADFTAAGNYILIDEASGIIRLYLPSDPTQTSTSQVLTVTPAALLPKGNLSQDLGASGTRWLNIFGQELNLSGKFGCNGVTPPTRATLSAALLTDGSATSAQMATAINTIRTALVNCGIGQ